MRADLDTMLKAHESGSAFNEADLDFHLAIAQASGNTVLFGALSNVRSLLRVWIAKVTAASISTERSYQEHVPIYEAIAAGDPTAAAAAMRVHMQSARARLSEALQDPEHSVRPR